MRLLSHPFALRTLLGMVHCRCGGGCRSDPRASQPKPRAKPRTPSSLGQRECVGRYEQVLRDVSIHRPTPSGSPLRTQQNQDSTVAACLTSGVFDDLLQPARSRDSQLDVWSNSASNPPDQDRQRLHLAVALHDGGDFDRGLREENRRVGSGRAAARIQTLRSGADSCATIHHQCRHDQASVTGQNR